MDFVFDNLQVLIIVGAVIAAGLNQLREKKKREQEEPWQPQAEDYNPADPFEPAPPRFPIPKIRGARPDGPPPLPQFVELPEPELARQRNMKKRLKTNRAAEAVSAIKTSGKIKPRSPRLVSPTKLRTRLRDKTELRRAIVLREILGPCSGSR